MGTYFSSVQTLQVLSFLSFYQALRLVKLNLFKCLHFLTTLLLKLLDTLRFRFRSKYSSNRLIYFDFFSLTLSSLSLKIKHPIISLDAKKIALSHTGSRYRAAWMKLNYEW